MKSIAVVLAAIIIMWPHCLVNAIGSGSEKILYSDMEFSISFELAPREIRLKSDGGTAWSGLGFSCPGGTCRQQINYYGMVNPPRDTADANPERDRFLIEFHRKGMNVTLTCLAGCEWDVLKFELDRENPTGSFTSAGY